VRYAIDLLWRPPSLPTPDLEEGAGREKKTRGVSDNRQREEKGKGKEKRRQAVWLADDFLYLSNEFTIATGGKRRMLGGQVRTRKREKKKKKG